MSQEHERFDLPSFSENVFVVFGYGSILWKQNFEFTEVYDAYVKGYTRTFYQGCCDHRGVPGKPGRVATLLPNPDGEARVYGKAFVLPLDPEKLAVIFDALDFREQGGYVRKEFTLYDAHAEAGQETVLDIRGKSKDDAWRQQTAGKGLVCLCYIATEENEGYLGEAPLDEMARQIVCCEGQSGPNVEYLLLLAEELRHMGAQDSHVYGLEEAVLRIMKEAGEERVKVKS